MHKSQRLRHTSDFDAVYKTGRSEGNRLLVVRARASGASPSRIGFVTTRALGGAVVRNRVKRRLRAATAGLDILEGLDIVVSARRPAVEESFESLGRALRTLLNRVGAIHAAAQEPK